MNCEIVEGSKYSVEFDGITISIWAEMNRDGSVSFYVARSGQGYKKTISQKTYKKLRDKVTSCYNDVTFELFNY